MVFNFVAKLIFSMSETNTLWTKSFIAACIGNFLLFFAFYLLVPVFPIYLIDEYGASKSLIGLLLSSYTVAALLIRPFAGFILDMVYRKPIYLAAYILFVITFVGYPLANTIGLFLFFRILHGFTFGFVTTAGNSLIVDVTPAARRGEGLGFFGVANTIAMAVGPMTGLYLHDYYSYDIIFYTAIGTGLLGFVFASFIKAERKPIKRGEQIVLDRFFLFEGFRAGFALLLVGIPYGMVVTYVAIFGKEIGISSGVGLFFTFMAIGLTASRFFSGRMVDRGKLVQVVVWGTALSAISFFLLPALNYIDNKLIITISFYIISFIMGIGYGMIFPAYNTLFVNLAPNNRRATASSTYMTSWDIGIGLGLVSGGMLADSANGLQLAYLYGAIIAFVSLVFFAKIAGPHFVKNKLR